jgi:hypothetical protein
LALVGAIVVPAGGTGRFGRRLPRFGGGLVSGRGWFVCWSLLALAVGFIGGGVVAAGVRSGRLGVLAERVEGVGVLADHVHEFLEALAGIDGRGRRGRRRRVALSGPGWGGGLLGGGVVGGLLVGVVGGVGYAFCDADSDGPAPCDLAGGGSKVGDLDAGGDFGSGRADLSRRQRMADGGRRLAR